MPKTVNIPGVGRVNFPDDMSEAQIIEAADGLSRRVGPTMQQPEQRVTEAARMVAPAILPGALSVGGMAVGGLAAPFLGPAAPVGPIAGEALGGALGEYLNQQIGLTEPSGTQIALAGAAGPVTRGVFRGARGIGRFAGARLPGGPEVMNRMAIEEAKGLRIPVQTASEELYQQVAQRAPGLNISATNLSGALDELVSFESKLSPGSQNKDIIRFATGLKRKIAAAGGELPFEDIQAEMRRIGQRTGSVREKLTLADPKTREAQGAYRRVFAALNEDLDAAVRSGAEAAPAVGLLREATKTAKREFAQEELSTMIEKAIKPRGEFQEFQANQVLRALKENKFFRKSVEPQEYEGIIKTLEKLAATPALPPKPGAMYGSGALVMRGSLGALGGYAAGRPDIGATVGIAAPALIGAALQTQTGRNLLLKVLGPDRILRPEALSLLGGFVRAQTGETKWPPKQSLP